MSQQTLITVDVPIAEVMRKPSLGKAIEYCAELAGFSYDKALEEALKKNGVTVDCTQLTRWKQGAEGIKWPKLCGVMDTCGNDAPLLWMNHDRGWDINSLRRRETETQRENRLLREEVTALRRVVQGMHS